MFTKRLREGSPGVNLSLQVSTTSIVGLVVCHVDPLIHSLVKKINIDRVARRDHKSGSRRGEVRSRVGRQSSSSLRSMQEVGDGVVGHPGVLGGGQVGRRGGDRGRGLGAAAGLAPGLIATVFSSDSGSGTSSKSISNSSEAAPGVTDGVGTAVSPGFGPGPASATRRRGRPTFSTRSLTGPIAQLVARLEHSLAFDLLAVEERPVGAAQVLDQEHPVLLEELAVLAADLRRLDPELAFVVPPGRGDAVAELQGGRGAPTAEDDELEIPWRSGPGVGATPPSRDSVECWGA